LAASAAASGTPHRRPRSPANFFAQRHVWIAPAVARDTRVCVYDRAGRGWSEPTDTAQDATQIATDLDMLLQRGHVPGPYVLAGPSFGGLYTLTFGARYPDEVAGIVLVDSTAPASAAKPKATPAGNGDTVDDIGRVSALVSNSARLGLGRLYGQFAFGSLPPQSRDEVRASLATAGSLRRAIDEYVPANASMEEAAALDDFADKPLVVLTAGSGHDDAWSTAQNELATLSTNSVHRVIAGATHEALVAGKDHAAATEAALDVV
jgi:pimeloyl-ACP methyl ester carboxylesterase